MVLFGKLLDVFDPPVKDDIHAHIKKHEMYERVREWYGLCIALLLASLAFSTFFYIKYRTYTPPALIQYTQDELAQGKVSKEVLITFEEPRVSRKYLQRWATNFVNDFYNINFNNVKNKVYEDEKYFTPEAFQSFLKSFEVSGLLDDIYNRKQMMTLTATGEPRIIGAVEGVEKNGYRFWQIEVPAKRAITSGRTDYRDMTVKMMLVMITENNKTGFYISELEIL